MLIAADGKVVEVSVAEAVQLIALLSQAVEKAGTPAKRGWFTIPVV